MRRSRCGSLNGQVVESAAPKTHMLQVTSGMMTVQCRMLQAQEPAFSAASSERIQLVHEA